MPMMNKAQYLESMKNLKPNLYAFGKKIDNLLDFPPTRANINAISLTYELAPERPILRAKSHLTGNEINRFLQIQKTKEDLFKRIELMRWLTPQHGGCVGARCVGCDALQAVFATSYDIDAAKGTKYHENFKNWLKMCEEKDLSVAGCMTDIKGDRNLKPGKQPDPDSFVHVVERRKDGIIVRGAKAHMSGAPVTHELLVMPTENMTEGDADYALSFACPSYAPGVTQIFEAPAGNFRWMVGEGMDLGNPKYGIHGASLLVFDNVFIPWERVFMCGEYEFSGSLVLRFADQHRFTFSACKTGHCDLMAGACTLAAEMLGTEKVGHVRDKITEICEMAESCYGNVIASAALCTQTPAGTYVPNTIYVNIAKIQGIKAVYRAGEIGADIAGGLVCTQPSEADFKNPVTGPIIEKYLTAKEGYSARDRIKVLRFIEYGMGGGSVIPPESLLGGGTPVACRLMVRLNTAGNVKYARECVKKIIDL